MQAIDLTNVQESGDYKRPDAGAYICKITGVEDVSDKQYMFVWYDIAEGEFAGYYTDMRTNNPEWTGAGRYVKSYKPKALPMLKRFCSAVSKSNGSYVFDAGKVNSDEKSLIGKKIGLIFREEEYYGNDGEKKTRLIVHGEFPVADIAKQFVPSVKKLAEDAQAGNTNDGVVPTTDDDAERIPF